MSDRISTRPTTLVTVAAFALVFAALAACASFETRLAPPKVTVEGIAVGGIRGSEAMVTLSLRLENPNATDLMLQSLRFGLSINDIALTSGATARVETIPAGGSAVIELETRTNVNAVLQVIALSAGGRMSSLQYALDGDAVVQNGIRLAFARRGDIPLPAAPAPAPSR
jgi:LEA14-like dessication related protein